MTKQLSKLFLLVISCQLLAIGYLSAQTGTWTALTNLPINPNNGVCLLMTDGTVICHNNNGGTYGTGWDRLTPDIHGSYINGTWDTIASMINDRIAFSSQVLPSGRVYVAGGEYGVGGGYGEVYDPVANAWNACGALPGGWNIYDGNSELLYDGTVLEGPQIGANPSYDILIWSPVTNQYTIGPSSIYNHDEAQWLKLPDSSVLFVGIASQNANRYIPQTGTWVNDANTPGELYDYYGEESGCALMLPNGKAIFFGATPYNAIYTPSGNSSPGTWTSADSFPVIQGSYVGQPDASGAMMVNGHILLAVSPIGTAFDEYNTPCYFVEYDYVTNTFAQVKSPIPGQGGDSISYIACYLTQMLDLPDGNVLLSISQTDSVADNYYIYTPGSGPIPQGKPTINSIIPDGCSFYKITGKLFNGISEGAAFGDDWQMATNYPLVRLTDGTNVYYAKTTNWNRIGAVQTDSLEDTAYFALPPSLPGGTYSVEVVVNGFASNPALLGTIFGVSISSQTNVTCYGSTNGSATALPADGTAPYTYSWAPSGGNNATASNLSAGTYTVTVNGYGGGCSVSAVVTITQPNALSIGANSTNDPLCNGDSNGSASVWVSGGSSPFTYSWSPGGQTNTTATGLSAGTYTITVSDQCGSTSTGYVTINQPAVIVVTGIPVNTTSNTSCNGEATAIVSGGTPYYNYLWNPGGQTNQTATGLCAGTYCCNITDVNGCTGSSCVIIASTAGIDNMIANAEKITVYPNPNAGQFTMQIGDFKPGQEIVIYNVLGQQVYSQFNIHLASGETTFNINLSSQPDGVYLYRILEKDGSAVGEGKVLVEK